MRIGRPSKFGEGTTKYMGVVMLLDDITYCKENNIDRSVLLHDAILRLKQTVSEDGNAKKETEKPKVTEQIDMGIIQSYLDDGSQIFSDPRMIPKEILSRFMNMVRLLHRPQFQFSTSRPPDGWKGNINHSPWLLKNYKIAITYAALAEHWNFLRTIK